MKIVYPIYLIASTDGVLIVSLEGKDCILLFQDRAHAERHIRELNTAGCELSLHALGAANAEEFEEGIRGLPADITCAVWDASLSEGNFAHVPICDLLDGPPDRN